MKRPVSGLLGAALAAFLSLVALGVSAEVALAVPPTPEVYVPILGRSVPASVLETPVRIADAAFGDYGAVLARGDLGVTGKGVEVCVVDTGADPYHEQLDTRIVAFKDFTAKQRPTAYDDHGHGTHVASIVAGDGAGASPGARRYRGVAPRAVLSIAKALDANGSGSFETVIAAISWCAHRPTADVISMSLGSPYANDGHDALSAAVNAAVETYGKVAVVAAGNDGPMLSTIGTPGMARAAITVGAAAEWSGKPGSAAYSGGPYLAVFSGRGNPEYPANPKPDVIAPGVTITAAKVGGGYATYSGTSMATPYIAGTVALMLEADPSLGPARIREVLAATALDVGRPGHDADWGAGLVNTYDAVASLLGLPGRDIFPPHVGLEGTIANGRTYFFPPSALLHYFIPTDPDQPIAATVIIDQDSVLAWPHFVAALRAPSEEFTVLDTSLCPNDRPCGVGASGRQQTLSVMPSTSTRILPGMNYYLVVAVDAFWGGPLTLDGTFYVDLFFR